MEKIITEKDISRNIKRLIESPIRVGSVSNLGMDKEAFINYFSPLFEELPWDPYDPRRLRVEFLKSKFENDANKIQQYFTDYFTGQVSEGVFKNWIEQLNENELSEYKAIQPWRRRSVAQFLITDFKNKVAIKRQPVDQFTQGLDSDDFRSLPRIFEEAPSHHVENELFNYLLLNFFNLAKAVKKDVKKAQITAHFMSVKSTAKTPGDNSPEGAHEDGADFIVSALVINRINIQGGETQILEQFPNGKRDIIFRHTLQAGEFVFQADTREEIIYGNDLWHHVTPFYLKDTTKAEGWRDIIGFDINTG